MKTTRAAIYTRIITGEQNSDLQTRELPSCINKRLANGARVFSYLPTTNGVATNVRMMTRGSQ